jgi:hypothetical protein
MSGLHFSGILYEPAGNRPTRENIYKRRGKSRPPHFEASPFFLQRQGNSVNTNTAGKSGRYSVSLRVLMLLVLVLGGGFGWTVNRMHRRQRPVVAVRKAKGVVQFDYRLKHDQIQPNGKPWPPAWLLGVLPEEFFHDVTGVNRLDLSQIEEADARAAVAAIGEFDLLERLRITNPPPGTTISGKDQLKVLQISLTRPSGDRTVRLRALPRLTKVHLDGKGVNDSLLADFAGLSSVGELRLQNTNVTDAGLAHLAGLADLQFLWVDKANVTDAGLSSLVKLKKLEILNLNGNPGVTDKGVHFLSLNLPGLKHLLIGGTSVTDAALADLSAFTALEGLQIEGQSAKITDSGLDRLERLTHLEVLNIAGSGVTDAGVGNLRSLKRLRWLNLDRTAVGDEGLRRLCEMKSLRWLSLNGTNITDAGLESLSRLTGLEKLQVMKTRISDRGLKHLYRLKSLKSLFFSGTEVTAEGRAALREALPEAFPSSTTLQGKASVPRPITTTTEQ